MTIDVGYLLFALESECSIRTPSAAYTQMILAVADNHNIVESRFDGKTPFDEYKAGVALTETPILILYLPLIIRAIFTMVNPFNNLNVIMQKEDYTNAIWNYILNQAFRAPDYLVVPELHFQNGHGWADLAVMKLGNPDRLILVYEGKKSGGAFFAVNDALQQAYACAKSYGDKHTPALVAAIGPRFRMAHCDGTPSTAFPADKDGISDIMEGDNWDKIAGRMTQIRNSNGSYSGL